MDPRSVCMHALRRVTCLHGKKEGQKIKFLRLRMSHVTLDHCILQIGQRLAQKGLSIIHSFSKYLVRAFPGPGTVLGTEHTMICKCDRVLLSECFGLVGETIQKTVSNLL